MISSAVWPTAPPAHFPHPSPARSPPLRLANLLFRGNIRCRNQQRLQQWAPPQHFALCQPSGQAQCWLMSRGQNLPGEPVAIISDTALVRIPEWGRNRERQSVLITMKERSLWSGRPFPIALRSLVSPRRSRARFAPFEGFGGWLIKCAESFFFLFSSFF